jgi:hypothetical protein
MRARRARDAGREAMRKSGELLVYNSEAKQNVCVREAHERMGRESANEWGRSSIWENGTRGRGNMRKDGKRRARA